MSDLTIRRHLVETPLGTVHYRSCGEGPVLLLVHQTADSSREFLAAMPGLAAAGRRVIAMDTLGYGESDPAPAAWDVAGYADAIIGFLDALAIPQAALLGNHSGAVFVLEAAVRHPSRVTALVAVGLTLWDEAERTRRRQMHFTPFPIQEDGSHLLGAWGKYRARHPDVPLEIVHRGAVDLLRSPDYLLAYDAVFSYDMAPRLPLVQCPALVLTGVEDVLDPCTDPAAAAMPKGRAVHLEGAGIYLPDLALEPFLAAVNGFLDEVVPVRPG